MRGSVKAVLIASAAFGAIALGVIKAQAGGITLRQSSYFQGLSWAGVAAGGPSVSAMFWNPATITQAGLGLRPKLLAPSTRLALISRPATSATGVNLTGRHHRPLPTRLGSRWSRA
jgi:long-chain fatty acid transport protein